LYKLKVASNFSFDLILSLLFLYVVTSIDREVSKFVRILARCDNTKVISELLLLQVSLSKVLKLSLGELNIAWGRNGKLGAVTRDSYTVTGKVGGLAVNLNAILKVLLERSNIKNLILNRGGAVNDELYGTFLCLGL